MLVLVRCVAPGPVPRMSLHRDMALMRLALSMVLALTMTVTMVLVRSVPRLSTCSRLLTVPPRVCVTLLCRHFEQAHDISALDRRWGALPLTAGVRNNAPLQAGKNATHCEWSKMRGQCAGGPGKCAG
jgi:hypothetical protein